MSGDLSVSDLVSLERKTLKEVWKAEIGPVVPKNIRRKMMAEIILVERQWAASGQSRARYVKKLKRIVEVEQSSKPSARVGNRLIREWNGRRHVVDVLPEGYLWNGRTWRSLSALAKEITGTKWSGPRFFGVAG